MTTTSHADLPTFFIRVETETHGFLTADDVKFLASYESTRGMMLLVRCGGCRFLAPAQDVAHLIGIITEHATYLEGIEHEHFADHVRDVSLPTSAYRNLDCGCALIQAFNITVRRCDRHKPRQACPPQVAADERHGVRATLDAIADYINANFATLHADVDYPGVISITPTVIDRGRWLFIAGTVNGPWGADFYERATETSKPDGGIETDVPGNCTDADVIATKLRDGIYRFFERGGVKN